ncbi:hypothetical protein KUCAC02_019582 [Chaenocephalus aceratus]|uniref:Uncharacterized protein n=1 Tax=Chaenocephalus aceratus TaxID=36190 RepID=A0ACB9VPH1_CHAAC|nr:hypothetical protein KUCAC02_019582 [Chaenocephalus aceratus]
MDIFPSLLMCIGSTLDSMIIYSYLFYFSREVSRDRDKKRDQEDEEEAYDRRKLERKLRDKEAAYQERLKNWELRERKKARDYAKEAERDDERRREMVKEGKRTTGAVRCRSPEPEEERKRHKGSREHRDRRHEQPRPEPAARPPVHGGASPNSPGDESPCGIIIPHENSPPDALPQEENRPKIGLSLKMVCLRKPQPTQRHQEKELPGDSVFDKFDDEETSEQPRKRKLVPLDYDDDKSLGVDGASSIKGANTEEKRKNIKTLIEKIPTAKPELFSYPLDWTMVDTTLMDRRVRPWINKKIIEYIGEEEATLVDFVCTKVMAHSMPQSILDDVAMVSLDEEAEVFIVKMWRLLIYETEAKKIGLVK